MPEGTMPQSSACRYPEVAQALQGWWASQQRFKGRGQMADAIGMSAATLAHIVDGRALPRGEYSQRFFDVTGLACFSPKEQERRERLRVEHLRKYKKAHLRAHRKEYKAKSRERYQKNRDNVIAMERKRRKDRIRCVTPKEIEILRADPRKARPSQETTILTTKIGPDNIVCLECREIHETLIPHLNPEHNGMTAEEYKKKEHRYNQTTPRTSVNLSKKQSAKRKRIKHKPPIETQFGQRKAPPPELALKARRPGFARLEARLNRREKRMGKALPARWKRVGGRVIEDSRVAFLALGGLGPQGISRCTGLSLTAASFRYRRLGFSPKVVARYVFGEPVTTQHFFDLCEDYAQIKQVSAEKARREVVKRLGISESWASHRLTRLKISQPLSVNLAERFLGLQKSLKREYIRRSPGPKGGRPRSVLPSEEKRIPIKYHQLGDDISRLLRRWREESSGKVSKQALKHVLGWLCAERRAGRIRVLLFMPEFFKWMEKTFRVGYYLDEQALTSSKRLALQFLAASYGVSPDTISRIVWPRRANPVG